ncbi:hypothetical protein [Eubacterium sp. 1001713B170207_170306_E7]|uniref:hypothetical protein n=1 Tax=Eubacterium sp. 1001713B170207_170306_E7 TaxID=2787097 RepID=UPI00189BA93D|nr:hypothetical protein [Eubacterium sp. 1001713B170207_170306_E7]
MNTLEKYIEKAIRWSDEGGGYGYLLTAEDFDELEMESDIHCYYDQCGRWACQLIDIDVFDFNESDGQEKGVIATEYYYRQDDEE